MKKLLQDAKKYCEAHGLRLTEPRLNVFEIILNAGKPVGAYDVIDAMPKGTKPPTVYRALEFWEQEGFLHKISSLNLYAACQAGHRHHSAQFLICDNCGDITEAHLCDMPSEIEKVAKTNKFKTRQWVLELRGLCGKCPAAEHGPHQACAH